MNIIQRNYIVVLTVLSEYFFQLMKNIRLIDKLRIYIMSSYIGVDVHLVIII